MVNITVRPNLGIIKNRINWGIWIDHQDHPSIMPTLEGKSDTYTRSGIPWSGIKFYGMLGIIINTD